VVFGTKLRLLYECIPIAYLIRAAKGIANNGEIDILDVVVEHYEQKVGFIAGSIEEVEFINTTLKCGGTNVNTLDEEAKRLMENLVIPQHIL